MTPLRYTSLLLIFASCFVLAIQPVEATAQQYDDPGSRAEQSSPSNLPSWAEPSDGGTTSQNQGISPTGPIGNAPPPPDDPSRIPVDGGLSLLALAGAGYAVRKLKSKDDPESDQV